MDDCGGLYGGKSRILTIFSGARTICRMWASDVDVHARRSVQSAIL